MSQLDRFLNEIQIAKTPRSAIPAHDLLYRTAKVDVDEVRLEHIRHERRSIAHRIRLRTKDLYADGMFFCAELQLRDGRRILPPDSLR